MKTLLLKQNPAFQTRSEVSRELKNFIMGLIGEVLICTCLRTCFPEIFNTSIPWFFFLQTCRPSDLRFYVSEYFDIMEFVLFLLLLCAGGAYSSALCPATCLCTGVESECYIKNCNDGLPIQAGILIIHGELCHQHRVFLTEHEQIAIYLEDDTCLELPNCRYYFY